MVRQREQEGGRRTDRLLLLVVMWGRGLAGVGAS